MALLASVCACSQITGPIALFNIVTYTRMLYEVNNFHLQARAAWVVHSVQLSAKSAERSLREPLQELTFESDPNKLEPLRIDAAARVLDLTFEYDVMLYGNGVRGSHAMAAGPRT
jgi:hypothetical protein